MKLYYYLDEESRNRKNRAGMDDTSAYIPALAAFMGVTAEPVGAEELDSLAAEDVLLVGAQNIEVLPSCGVILMGSGMGTEPEPSVRKKHVYAHYLTGDGYELPLFVPVKPSVTGGEILAVARDENGEEVPALVRRGQVFEFCFDLPGTVWFSGDGYVPEEPSDYFFIGRTPDFRPLPAGESSAEPFNDRLVMELEKILLELGVPMFYRLPPGEDGTVPDLAVHFSGDDDCASKAYNMQAALRMESYGFPYHINAMPMAGEYFIFDREVLGELEAHGCETALHLDFTEGVPYTAESVKAQRDLYEEHFGIAPLTNVNHCLIQGGTTAERMRWLQDVGVIADNGKLGEFDPADINAFDLCGFGYGTSFPRYTCDDAAHGNVMLTTMEIPLTYYEARLYREDSDPAKVTGYLDGAAQNGRIIQFFCHPHYLQDNSSDLEAVERVLKLIRTYREEKGYQMLCTTTNRIAGFWTGRSASRINRNGSGMEVRAEVPLVVVLPGMGADTVVLNGEHVPVVKKKVSGRDLSLVYVPAGENRICIAEI